MTSPRRLALICLAMFSLVATGRADDALRWKFQSGDEQRYRMTQTTQMELTLSSANRTIQTSSQQIIDWQWSVEDLDDEGNATIVLRVDRLQADMRAPGLQEMHFDTASEKSPTGFAAMLAPLSKALATASITITLSPRGTIKTVDLPQTLIDVERSLPGKKKPLPDSGIADVLRNEQAFTHSLQHALFELPMEQDLAAAKSWTQENSQPLPTVGEFIAVTTYRYTGTSEVKDKVYEAFSARSKLDFGKAADDLQIDIVDHESEGEILFDRAAGRLQSNKLQQQTDLKIAKDGQETLVKMTQSAKFELVTGQEEQRP